MALLILSVGIVGGGFVRVVFLPEIPSDTIEARVTMVEGSPEVQLRNTLAKLEQAAQKLPNSGVVQFHLAMVLKEVGQPARAAETLQKAIRLAPSPDANYVKTALVALEAMKAAPLAN